MEKTVTCKRCNTGNLYWKKVAKSNGDKDYWRLFDKEGNAHNCTGNNNNGDNKNGDNKNAPRISLIELYKAIKELTSEVRELRKEFKESIL